LRLGSPGVHQTQVWVALKKVGECAKGFGESIALATKLTGTQPRCSRLFLRFIFCQNRIGSSSKTSRRWYVFQQKNNLSFKKIKFTKKIEFQKIN